jgi:hypothetical protein
LSILVAGDYRRGASTGGSVHESTFYKPDDGPAILVLGGRSWKTNHLDWKRRIAHVEPTDERGRSRWLDDVRPVPNATAIQNMKFTECLSPELAAEVFCARFNDMEAVTKIVGEPQLAHYPMLGQTCTTLV